MAGEIEEPFRLNLQADSLHSGSISFGRFESEALCWERRSSFSHNRYLEEVEKYSKPGTVTEKKAYFEAHFRKRGILGDLGQGSPDSQNEKEYQTSENDTSESSIHNGESGHMNIQNNSARFDESPIVTSYDVENEVIQFENEVFRSSIFVPQINTAYDDTYGEESVSKNIEVEESQSSALRDLFTSDSIPGNGMKENFDGKEVNFDTIGDYNDNNEVEEYSISSNPKDEQAPSCKEKAPSEDEQTKPRLMPRLVAKSRRYILSKDIKGPKNKPEDNVYDVIRRPRKDVKNTDSAVQNKYQMHKTPSHEPGSRTKGINGLRSSARESRDRALGDPQSCTVQKPSTRMRRSANRSKPATGEAKPGVKHDSVRFGSKHSEHSQRKRQFGVGLEEKVHCKDATMHQLHTKTQEKKSELKKMSKSLNFKATPMPSFYHKALRESDNTKAAVSSVKQHKPRTNSLGYGTGTRVCDRTPLRSEKGTRKTSEPAQYSGAMSCHSTVTSDSNPPSPAAAGNHLFLCENNRMAGVQKGQVSLRKNKVPQANQVNKGKTMDGTQNTRTGRTTTTSITFKK